MDPDCNIEEQFRLASRIIEAFENDRQISKHDANQLSELVIALDEWIHNGGFLPTRWQR